MPVFLVGTCRHYSGPLLYVLIGDTAEVWTNRLERAVISPIRSRPKFATKACTGRVNRMEPLIDVTNNTTHELIIL